MDDGLRDTAEQLVDHGRLVLFGNTVEGFLDNMTSEGIHAKSECVTTNGLGDRDDLVGRAMFEATLNEEVTEAVDHQRIGLGDDCFDDLILLLRCSNLQLLLKKDGCLLVVVADDLVDNVLPVAAHVAVQQASVVHGFDRRNILRSIHLARSLYKESVQLSRRQEAVIPYLRVPGGRTHPSSNVELVRIRREPTIARGSNWCRVGGCVHGWHSVLVVSLVKGGVATSRWVAQATKASIERVAHSVVGIVARTGIHATTTTKALVKWEVGRLIEEPLGIVAKSSLCIG
jgi:hypothetical protein